MTQIVPDTGEFDTAAVLTIPDQDSSGLDWRMALVTLVAGDRLLLLVNNSRNRHYHYQVLAATVPGAGTVQVPVALVERQGAAIIPGGPEHINLQIFPRGIGKAAHGGMSVATSAPFPTIDATYQPIDVFDTIYLTGFGVTFDLPAGSFALDTTGTFVLTLLGSVAHNSSNSGRRTNVRLWDITAAGPIGSPFPIGIGRNVEDTTIALTLAFVVDLPSVNDAIRFDIGGGDTLSAVTWSALAVTLWAISA